MESNQTIMFTDKQRQIYEAPFGWKYDPLAVERKLVVVSEGKLNDFLDLWEGEDRVQAAIGEENLVRVARTAFGLPPVTDPKGVSDAVVLETLVHFLDWLSFPASAADTLPTSLQSTDCQD